MWLAEEGLTSVNLSSLSSLKDLEPGGLGAPVSCRHRELKFSGAGGAWKLYELWWKIGIELR